MKTLISHLDRLEDTRCVISAIRLFLTFVIIIPSSLHVLRLDEKVLYRLSEVAKVPLSMSHCLVLLPHHCAVYCTMGSLIPRNLELLSVTNNVKS